MYGACIGPGCDPAAVNTNLPDGWTIERVRSVSGDAEAGLLSLERLVVVEQVGFADYDVLQPGSFELIHGSVTLSRR